MTLVLVEVADEAAMQRLHLQGVRVVGVLTQPPSGSVAPAIPAAQPRPSIANLVGSLSDESAERMRTETTQMRNEWGRDF